MRRYFVVACLTVVLTSSAIAEPWQFLFNGTDLSGWHPVGGAAENWTTGDGLLSCNGKPGAQWLATDGQYDDFELALEFNISEGGNSGVFIRAPQEGAPYVEGMEIQLLDDFADRWKDLGPDGFNGSIYAVIAPSKRVTKKAGEWQSMSIRCVGRQIQVTVNGEQIIDANLDDYSEHAEKVRGLNRTTGHIGLQNHGDKISFRKIRLREIDAGAEAGKKIDAR